MIYIDSQVFLRRHLGQFHNSNGMELETKQTPHQQGRPERKTSDDSENADERNQQKLNLSGSTNTEEGKDWKWCDACQCQFTNENVSLNRYMLYGLRQSACFM